MAKALPVAAIAPGGSLAGNAPLILHTRLEEMYRFAPRALLVEHQDDLHAMRIAAKRLRYTMEIFAPAFAGAEQAKEFDWLADKVKTVQEQIGDIHDADVRMPLLHEFLARHAPARPEIRTGLEALLASEQARRDAAFAAFVKAWTKLQAQDFKRRFLVALALVATPRPEEIVPSHAAKQ